ncbi:F-box domain containing protein [Trema orientale]|uniref:F-box domain containing protein n=1 Tax=Trema orientale TaxID=63057 RepID=A0A2P5CCH6_TREOI|nr:F-box domain containing protein [Trema orientale]
MATLPWDSIVGILTRLPVKDLLRYRCVSKPWCSLIDGPDFIKMHLNHSVGTSSNLSLIRGYRVLHSVDLDTLDSAVRLTPPINVGNEIKILGCCNGLVALANSSGVMALWNPSTRKHKKVPVSDPNYEVPFGVFDSEMVGFGYDPLNDDYKLLRVIHYIRIDSDSFQSEVKVYSLKSNTWKRVGDFPYQGYKKYGIGVFASNSLHWMVARDHQYQPSFSIAAFDLVTEEYRKISLPDKKVSWDDKFYTKLAELGGWLCVVSIYVDDEKAEASNYVDIWVMKQYGVKESWTKLFSVAPSYVTGSFEYAMPLAYLKSAHQVVLDQDGHKFLLYDLERKRAKSVRKITGLSKCFDTFVYVRSLVGLGGGDGDNNGKKAGENGNKRKKQNQRVSGQKRLILEGFCWATEDVDVVFAGKGIRLRARNL